MWVQNYSHLHNLEWLFNWDDDNWTWLQEFWPDADGLPNQRFIENASNPEDAEDGSGSELHRNGNGRAETHGHFKGGGLCALEFRYSLGDLIREIISIKFG